MLRTLFVSALSVFVLCGCANNTEDSVVLTESDVKASQDNRIRGIQEDKTLTDAQKKTAIEYIKNPGSDQPKPTGNQTGR
jgi:protein involved in sex pheromone biosynthesis